MLEFPRKEKRKTRWREREKKEKSKGGKGFRIEWDSIKGNKKGLCKKKQKCFACYEEGKNFVEPCLSLSDLFFVTCIPLKTFFKNY